MRRSVDDREAHANAKPRLSCPIERERNSICIFLSQTLKYMTKDVTPQSCFLCMFADLLCLSNIATSANSKPVLFIEYRLTLVIILLNVLAASGSEQVLYV